MVCAVDQGATSKLRVANDKYEGSCARSILNLALTAVNGLSKMFLFLDW